MRRNWPKLDSVAQNTLKNLAFFISVWVYIALKVH